MKVTQGLMAATMAGVALIVVARLTAQAPPPQAPPPAPGTPVQGHGGPPQPGAPPAPRERDARFPAQQRAAADPAIVERGRSLYVGACGACHGVDARGGQLGGPNLLRSQLVLNDQDGELIFPVVKNGRPGTIMVPIPMSEPDVKAVAVYLHALQAASSPVGEPPRAEPVALNILVGDASAGAAFFTANCASCHSATGDLQGIATRVAELAMLQNLWVSGGRATGRGGGGGRPSDRSVVTATVTFPAGEKVEGRLVRLDDFLVTIAQPDGTMRTIRRNGDEPRVEIRDPLEKHRELLAVYTNANMHDVTAYLATLK